MSDFVGIPVVTRSTGHCSHVPRSVAGAIVGDDSVVYCSVVSVVAVGTDDGRATSSPHPTATTMVAIDSATRRDPTLFRRSTLGSGSRTPTTNVPVGLGALD